MVLRVKNLIFPKKWGKIQNISRYVPSQRKKLRNKFIIMLWSVYNTGLNFLSFFQVTETKLTFLIAFFLVSTNIKANFYLSRPNFPNFFVKSLKGLKLKVHFDSDYFMFDEVLQY